MLYGRRNHNQTFVTAGNLCKLVKVSSCVLYAALHLNVQNNLVYSNKHFIHINNKVKEVVYNMSVRPG